MPLFRYEALDNAGKTERGQLEAESPAMARASLRKKQLYPIKIEVEAVVAKNTFRDRGRAVSLIELSAFSTQLATLIRSGMPLLQSLHALGEQAPSGRWKTILAQVKDQVSSGSSLADAMGQHSCFDTLYVSLVKAGEASGSLDQCLTSLGNMLQTRARLVRKIWGAMAYPILMSVVGFVLMLVMFTFVLPQVTHLFADIKQDLPIPTRLLMWLSGFVRSQGVWLLIFLVLGSLVFRAALKKPQGRLWWDRLRLRVPLFGPLAQKSALARMTSALGTLVRGGVPLLQSLEISAAVAGNKVLEMAFLDAAEQVRKGSTLAAPLAKEPMVPPVVVHMLRVGEESGNLDGMLLQITSLFEEEVEQNVATLTSLLEPLLILVMGVVIGFLVLAILLPIFQLNQASF